MMIITDRKARVIMHLVAYVRLSVRPSVRPFVCTLTVELLAYLLFNPVTRNSPLWVNIFFIRVRLASHSGRSTFSLQATSYYNLSSVCGRVCPETTPPFMGTKLGRKVGVGHGKNMARFVSMETTLLPWKQGFSLTAKILGPWWRFFVSRAISVILKHLQKMSIIYLAV